MAHITGGGLVGNVPRMLPAKTRAVIMKDAWPRPDLFTWLQQSGNIADEEMVRVFNCGIGMVIALPKDQVAKAKMLLEREGELVHEIGRVQESSLEEPECLVV
jgi:phosphoribosylformylglycinamidine cyclo-ligase